MGFLVAWLTLVAVAVLAAPAGAATRGPCEVDDDWPRCHLWGATVVKVSDGDTISADIDGASTAEPTRIRLTGVQAMELTRYAKKRGRVGECLGVDATERLEELIEASGNRVRLAAIDRASSSGKRLRRHVAVLQNGAWVDAGAVLLQEGLALWMASDTEWAWNSRYSRVAQDAAARKVGIWDGKSCGLDGLSAAANSLELKVKWNAGGDDGRNLNGEWVRITNTSRLSPVPLGGWWFRDSNLRRFNFPEGAVLPAGGSLRVRVGVGQNDRNTYHWALSSPAFDNATNDRRQMGDGGYLFDPRGNLRAHVQYPCRTACPEPLRDKVQIRAHPYAPEYVRIRNVSQQTINLSEYELERSPWFYEFNRGTVLFPRQRLDLYMQRGPGLGNGAYSRSWGQQDRSWLGDRVGVVTLRNPLGAPVGCDAWGGARCPDV